MPWPVLKIIVIALLLLAARPALADLPADARAAIERGTKQMLDGDYDGALATAGRLQQQFPENGYGHTLAINALVTKLSWDEHDESLDDKLTAEAKRGPKRGQIYFWIYF